MSIWLWLDDERPAPEGWTHVKTVVEAISYLTGKEEVECASLDHDLGEFTHTGYDLVCFMEKFPGTWPTRACVVHSMNPIGARRMQVVINRHYTKGE